MSTQLAPPRADAPATSRSAPTAGESLGLPPRRGRWSGERLALAVTFALIAVVYAPIAVATLVDCWNDPNYSHGVLLPLVAALLVRQRMHDAVAADASMRRRAVWFTWACIASGCAAHILGAAAAESFTLRMSGIFLAVGLCGVVGGTAGLVRFGPAVALLACAVPLPYVLYYRISFPMQLVSAQLASGLLGGLGFDVTRSGNVFHVGGHALEVVGACSGIRSMMALATLALVGGVWLRLGAARIAALAALALPVAMCGNLLRLAATALLVLRFGPQAAEGAIHDTVGVVCFALSLGLLMLVLRALRAVGRRRSPAAATPSADRPRMRLAWPRLAARVVWPAAVAIGLTLGYGAWLRSHAAGVVATPDLETIPLQLAEYAGTDVAIDARTQEQLQADAYLFRTYAHPQQPSVGLYLGYYRDPRQGAQIHSPLHCYPGGGWKVLESQPLRVRDLDGQPTRMQRLLVRKQDRRDVVVYWYDTRTGRLTGDVALKLNLMRTALLHQPQDVAFVRWSTRQAEGESVDAATRRLLRTVAIATPPVEAALPFGD